MASQFDSGDLINERFVVIMHLGGGGFGEAYHAFDTEMRTQVCIKVISDRHFNIESLVNEFNLLQGIDHPNVVKTYGFVPPRGERGREALVTHFVRGPSLQSRLDLSNNFNYPSKFRLLEQIAQGIAFLHVAGIIHGDLKPLNIVIDDESNARLIDFGLARRTKSNNQDPSQAEHNMAFTSAGGTHDYMAPEQHSGVVMPTSDIYAFGLIMHKLFNNELPRMNSPHTLFCYGVPDDITSELIKKLDDIYIRCTYAEPLLRFGSGVELMASLESMLAFYAQERSEGVYNAKPKLEYRSQMFRLGEISSLESLADVLAQLLSPIVDMDDWYRIDGVAKDEKNGNTDAYITFELEIGEELLKFRINGDTRIYALREFLRLCRKHSRYGMINPTEFLVVVDLPDGNRALRFKSNWDAALSRFRAKGFYCYTAESTM